MRLDTPEKHCMGHMGRTDTMGLMGLMGFTGRTDTSRIFKSHSLLSRIKNCTKIIQKLYRFLVAVSPKVG